MASTFIHCSHTSSIPLTWGWLCWAGDLPRSCPTWVFLAHVFICLRSAHLLSPTSLFSSHPFHFPLTSLKQQAELLCWVFCECTGSCPAAEGQCRGQMGQDSHQERSNENQWSSTFGRSPTRCASAESDQLLLCTWDSEDHWSLQDLSLGKIRKNKASQNSEYSELWDEVICFSVPKTFYICVLNNE